ncbi:MAG: hypothetical protein AAF720_14915 [Pseudomonadota bacterium]
MENICEMAALAKQQVGACGDTAFKMRFDYGPRHGRPGMRKNVEMVCAICEAIGDKRMAMSVLKPMAGVCIAFLEARGSSFNRCYS